MHGIPFNRAAVVGEELRYVAEAIKNGHISGDGPFTRRCHKMLEETLGVRKALLTTSCTHALEMAAILLDIKTGDEVIVPSFTFVSTVNAFVMRGARPVFADIRPDTLNIDETGLERLVTDRTRAVVVVHYAGVGCEMDAIIDIASRRSIAVIEDNAHGLFGKYRGRPLGAFGSLATLSFHETKNLTCGEGGALLINDPSLVERAEIIREKGTNRSRFFRGEVDKYTWVDVGSSYLPSDMLAAFLLAQIEQRGRIQARRREIWERYYSALQPIAGDTGIRLPVVPGHCEQPYHMFYMLLRSEADRDSLIADLRADGVHSVFHYLPLHLSGMGRRFGGHEGTCPVTEDVSARLLRLPFYFELTIDDQSHVIDAVRRWVSSRERTSLDRAE
ncbi:MAG: dTDP-4-amino-4,6-dideoxygalactose transaminase [Acidobacteriota bacterium]